MAPDAIIIDDLTRSFGSVRAVDQLQMRVPAGRIYGLVGPDGAGKTTTIRMLCGVLRPDSGGAVVAGVDAVQHPDLVRTRIGYMPQRFSLYTDLTVRENMLFFADIFGVPAADRGALMERLLAFSRLGPFQHRRAEALSGGMKQKLALACALIHQPQVLILDEPTTGVDPRSRREFWDILHDAVARHAMTVLIATPYMDEAERCHVVGFMRTGKLLASGSPRELRSLVRGIVVEVHAAPAHQAELALRQLAGVRDVQIFGDRLHLLADAPPDERVLARALADAGAALVNQRVVAPSMEDVFMYLLRGD